MSDYETEEDNTPTTLVPQLGSSPKFVNDFEYDMRILSIIESSDKLPDTFHARFYARVRYRVVILRERFWTVVQDEMLHLPISVNGRGRNDQIRGENALKGLPVQIERPPERPSVLDRITDRDKVRDYNEWKDRQDLGLE